MIKCLWLLAMLCSACAAMYAPTPRAFRTATATATGCRPDEVSTSGESLDGPQRAWQATCQGKRYSCSSDVRWDQIVNPECHQSSR